MAGVSAARLTLLLSQLEHSEPPRRLPSGRPRRLRLSVHPGVPHRLVLPNLRHSGLPQPELPLSAAVAPFNPRVLFSVAEVGSAL